VQVLDGLAALPLDARNREQLEWLADEVVEAGGEATIWIGEVSSGAQERELASRMAETVAADYGALTEEAVSARERPRGQRKRTLARLRRELRRIRAHSHGAHVLRFSPDGTRLATAGIDRSARALGAVRIWDHSSGVNVV